MTPEQSRNTREFVNHLETLFDEKDTATFSPRFSRLFRVHILPRIHRLVNFEFTSRETTNFTYPLTEYSRLQIAHGLAVALNRNPDHVLKFLEEPLADEDIHQHVITISRNSPFAHKTDERCDFGRRLGWYAVVRLLKPRVVVETGIDKGLGAVLLASALLRNKEEGYEGRYFGTDINPKAGYLFTGKYASAGEILYGDSIESLKQFDQPIDVFINDSDHSHEYEYREYQTVKATLSARAIILGDNAHASASLLQFSRETGRNFLFLREIPEDHWYPGAGIGVSFPR
ncbi:class I SAM-dependent methyltransferase [bacterium]|nr:class I SAM-dependent methyltransferase [bacterium]